MPPGVITTPRGVRSGWSGSHIAQLLALHWLAVEPGTTHSKSRRFPSKDKVKAVRRLLAGEDISVVAREIGASPDRLARWQQRFVDAGEAALASRKSQLSLRLWKHRKIALQWGSVIAVLILTVFFLTRFFESSGTAAVP